VTPERRKRVEELSDEWLGGKERIEGFRFLHNSLVKAMQSDGTVVTGWLLSVRVNDKEPVYTVEACDGSGDVQCLESTLELIESSNQDASQ
jgi:hypothetical protein